MIKINLEKLLERTEKLVHYIARRLFEFIKHQNLSQI